MNDILNERVRILAVYYAANGLAGMKPVEVMLLMSEKQRHLSELLLRIVEGRVSPVNLLLKRGLEAEITEISGHFRQLSRGRREH